MVLTAAETLGATATLGKITNPAYAIAVVDWSKNIAPNLAALAATDRVTSIAPFAFHLTLTTGETLNNLRLLSSSQRQVDIVDTAANVHANYAALAASSAVGSISVRDTAGNILPNIADLKKDSTKISVTVSDTAANVLANAMALSSDVQTIVVADTAANVVANAATLSKVAPSVSIHVVDIAANIEKTIDALNGDPQISTIKLTDGGAQTLTITTKQVLSDKKAIHDIENANYYIAILDTAANVSANFDALNTDNQVRSIVLTDSETPKLKLKITQTLGDTYPVKPRRMGHRQPLGEHPISLDVDDGAAIGAVIAPAVENVGHRTHADDARAPPSMPIPLRW